MKPKIDFLTIAVADLEKSVAFYQEGLGLPTDGIQEGNEDHCLFELANDFRRVLYRRQEFLSLTQTSAEAAKSAGFIISHIADSRAEVDAILQQAIQAGATQIGAKQDEPWGYSANFADPDGHHWEISFMPGNG
jgi:predicted lactoylglutathione lyase